MSRKVYLFVGSDNIQDYSLDEYVATMIIFLFDRQNLARLYFKCAERSCMSYIPVGHIVPFKYIHCEKVLPLTYDDSLSYYEVLAKCVNKLNLAINNLNTMSDNLDNFDERITVVETGLAEVQSEIDTFEESVNNRFTALEAQLIATINEALAEAQSEIDALKAQVEALSSEIDSKVAELSAEIENRLASAVASLTVLLNQGLQEMRLLIDLNNEEMKQYIDEVLEDFKESIPEFENVIVRDVITGELVNIQVALRNLYNYLRANAITAHEYDDLQLTAQEFDSTVVDFIPLGMTALQFDIDAKRYIWKDPKLYMNHVTEGEKELYKYNILALSDMLREAGSYNAEDFDAVGISAENYDSLDLSAYEFDWYSNRKIS